MKNLRNKNAPPVAGLVQKFLDTAFDIVKSVYDNLANITLVALGLPIEISKGITIENPTSSEDISIIFTDIPITITKIRPILIGSSTPSVTWTLRHATDRSVGGNEIVTGGTTTTEIMTGVDVLVFNDATILANSHIWLETTAKSGVVIQFALTLFYTEDSP